MQDFQGQDSLVLRLLLWSKETEGGRSGPLNLLPLMPEYWTLQENENHFSSHPPHLWMQQITTALPNQYENVLHESLGQMIREATVGYKGAGPQAEACSLVSPVHSPNG